MRSLDDETRRFKELLRQSEAKHGLPSAAWGWLRLDSPEEYLV